MCGYVHMLTSGTFAIRMKINDTFQLAYRTIKSNKVRTGITVAIIAFGIMALIGIITAIQAMNESLRNSFSTMGANGFTISYRESFRFDNDNETKKTQRNKKQLCSHQRLFKFCVCV